MYPVNPHPAYTVAWYQFQRDYWMLVARDTRDKSLDPQNTAICVDTARTMNREVVCRIRFLTDDWQYPIATMEA
jgi:hypothetical protein